MEVLMNYLIMNANEAWNWGIQIGLKQLFIFFTVMGEEVRVVKFILAVMVKYKLKLATLFSWNLHIAICTYTCRQIPRESIVMIIFACGIKGGGGGEGQK